MDVKVIKNKENIDIVKKWFEHMLYHIGKDRTEKLINRASITDIYII